MTADLSPAARFVYAKTADPHRGPQPDPDMHERIARKFHQVLGAGLELIERLERKDFPPLDAEVARLSGMLVGDSELKFDPEYAGETPEQAVGGRERFLGIRYALACWLDEVILDRNAAWRATPWRDGWNEQKLETKLFQTNDRAWKFWKQAEQAEARPGTDAVEAFYWCVMLGFRGEYHEQPEKMRAWADGVHSRVIRGQAQEFPVPPEKEPATYVPVLTGRSRFTAMLYVASALVLAAVPVLMFIGMGAFKR